MGMRAGVRCKWNRSEGGGSPPKLLRRLGGVQIAFYWTVRVRVVECDSVPEVAVTVIVWTFCAAELPPPHPRSPASKVPARISRSTHAERPHLPAACRIFLFIGSSMTRMNGNSPRASRPLRCTDKDAVWPGTWIFSETFVAPAPAASDGGSGQALARGLRLCP